jgi:2-keto-4-pentenoate hydratase/2-oxohepta-3-ene-1,7-dioic acid hydratase in catechol pathway
MRMVNADGRAALLVDGKVVDVERASRGAFASQPVQLYPRWSELAEWAAAGRFEVDGPALENVVVHAPSPEPRQVFGIGLNYREHAQEGGMDIPDTPMVFTKFPSCICGPYDEIALPPGAVDYEAELVVVIGPRAHRVPVASAWDHVAGLTIGQDLSERIVQTKPPQPMQFSLGKSFPGFGPIGPVLVTPDELASPDDLEIGCRLNGEQLQKARTSDLIFDVSALVSYLSGIVPLLPGDLIFTGTPSGVGFARSPKKLINAGDELVTYIEGLGSMRHTFIDGWDRSDGRDRPERDTAQEAR